MVGRARRGRRRRLDVRGWLVLAVAALVAAGVLAGLVDRLGR